jgi:thiamine kinase-like enzyme
VDYEYAGSNARGVDLATYINETVYSFISEPPYFELRVGDELPEEL